MFFNVFQKNSNMPGKSVSTLKRSLNSYIWQKRDCFENFLGNGNHGKVLLIKISKNYRFWHRSLSFLSREDLESIQDLNMRLDNGHTIEIPTLVNVLSSSLIWRYWIFVLVFYRQVQLKKSKQIFKIRLVQIDQLPRTLIRANIEKSIVEKLMYHRPFL